MESCCDLFYLLQAWTGYRAYMKKVSKSAFPPHEFTYVYIRAVPMRCTFAADIMQCKARKFVFELRGSLRSMEFHRTATLPQKDISLACLDGFDYIRRFVLRASVGKDESKDSDAHWNFLVSAHAICLPLMAVKSLVKVLRGLILVGELDGISGRLMHARAPGHKIFGTTTGHLWTRSLHKPGFSIGRELHVSQPGSEGPCFGFAKKLRSISRGRWNTHDRRHIPLEGIHEILVLAGSDLRALIRNIISISDASEWGGGSAEANQFWEKMCPRKVQAAGDWFPRICGEGRCGSAIMGRGKGAWFVPVVTRPWMRGPLILTSVMVCSEIGNAFF